VSNKNKDALTVLPSNDNKQSGLEAALKCMALSPHKLVSIDGAESDQAFLLACGYAVAADHAVEKVKAEADSVVADHGCRVAALVERPRVDDLAPAPTRVSQQRTAIGTTASGETPGPKLLATVLVAGTSGEGRSTIVAALVEQITDHAFHVCVVDPECDYDNLADAGSVSDTKQEPRMSKVIGLLERADVSVVVNLFAIEPLKRSRPLVEFLAETDQLRATTGYPHWRVLDEVYHLLSANWEPSPVTLPCELPGANAAMVHPATVSKGFLSLITMAIGVGDGADDAIRQFCELTGGIVSTERAIPERGEMLFYGRDSCTTTVKTQRPRDKRERHIRK
jgi:hypothetical protein